MEKTYRPLVYICSPASDDPGQTRRFCRFALESGHIPLAPQLLFPQFIEDKDLILLMSIVLLGKCSELWVMEGGVPELVEVAKKRRQPIRYFSNDFQEVEQL